MNSSEIFSRLVLSVPVRVKIAGIMVLPVIILGLTLNYWVKTGLSDWLSYLLSNERVRVAMEAGSRSVLFVTVLAAGVSVLLTFLLMFVLTRPLLELYQVARQVSDGKLETRARIWANDEIGQVARSVNGMIDRLVASQARMADTNRRLEAMNQVAMAAGRALDLNEVLRATLEGTLNVMGLQSGWVFLREPDSQQFYLATQQGASDVFKTPIQQLGEDELCACQRDLLSGALGKVAVVRHCHRIQSFLNGADTPYHISIPLEARGQNFGVVNLYYAGGNEPNAETLDLLTAIGAQASEIVANVWLHTRLVEKEAARQALLQALVAAQEDERSRLARELHDGAGQTLTSLLLRLKALEKQAESQGLGQNLAGLCEVVSETIDQIRDLSHRLRPVALEEFGLEVALRTLVQEIAEGADLTTTCNIDVNGTYLPGEIETSLYRIAQECFTNVIRHAQASHIQVDSTVLPHAVCLRVEDDGQGFDPALVPQEGGKRRLGLLSIQERTEMLGGSVVIYSAPGSGTSVQIRIPLPEENSE